MQTYIEIISVATPILVILIPIYIKYIFQKQHSKYIDELQWDRKVQEQASKVAEYLTALKMIRYVDDQPQPEKRNSIPYIEKANKLYLELVMWLPEDIFKAMKNAVSKHDEKDNEATVAIEVRKYLLKDKAGNLKPKDVFY